MESKDKIMLQCFRPNEQKVKIPNQRSADRFLREENMDFYSFKNQWGERQKA